MNVVVSEVNYWATPLTGPLGFLLIWLDKKAPVSNSK